jgi:Uma2 family endonuclease
MESMTITRGGEGFTRADLDAMAAADDRRRYELIDGAIVVTPSPVPAHQIISSNLNGILRDRCPPDLRVLYAPLDVVLAVDTVVVPDLIVARRSDFGAKDLPVPPLLAVEILSPSTRRIDLTLKRARYEAAGVPSYWLVDPVDPLSVGLSLTVWELEGTAYVETARAVGDELLEIDRPYPVRVVPDRLAD